MKVLINQLQTVLATAEHSRRYRGLASFTYAYLQISEAIWQCYRRFEDFGSVQAFASDFAAYYFTAVDALQSGGRLPQPWQAYGMLAKSRLKLPLLQLLVGAYAHIAGDLPMALRNHPLSVHDYAVVSKCIEKTLPVQMRYVAKQGSRLARLGVRHPVLTRWVYRRLIMRWRAQSYQAVQQVSTSSLDAATQRV